MHILQIYKDYYPVLGGIENHVRDVSELLAARGHQVTVLVSNTGNHTSIETPAPHLTVIKAARLAHVASTPFSPVMVSFAHALRPDVVHLHFPFPPGDLVARSVPNNPPLVVTYHSDIVRQKRLLQLYKPLLESTLKRAARIIATSPAYIKTSPFLRRYTEKCVVVPLGIDAERFTAAEVMDQYPTSHTPHPKHVLFVGRLRYYKGLHILLEAMPAIHGTLLIAGTGPEHAHLEQQAKRLGIVDRVRFLGDVPDADLPVLYRSADVFVLPAHLRAEAFGIAQLEAMASGLPCVSTELGTGTSFANQHGETGFVVPPGDPGALAAAINMLLANPTLRQRLGQNAQHRARALFDNRQAVTQIEDVYKQLA